MPPTDEPKTVARSRILRLSTQQPVQLVDITADVAAFVRGAGVRNGQVLIQSRHTTAAVRIQEDEPLLLEDLRLFLGRLAPVTADYHHNDFRVRTQHMHPDERPNGHAHCLQLLLGSSETVAVIDGELQLGTWQRLFLVELDGPRPERSVIVQVIGEASSSSSSNPAAARGRWRPVDVHAGRLSLWTA